MIAGLCILIVVLKDTFDTIVMPRTVTYNLRPTRLFYLSLWAVWRVMIRLTCRGERREGLLAAFGPLSLLLLLATWAVALIVSFACIQYGLGSRVAVSVGGAPPGFLTDLYMSGSTLFTLGFGDVTPTTSLTRAVAVCEAGVGFGFLGIVIGYLPIMYQSYAARERSIVLLDARAGSPPTAFEMLRRYAAAGDARNLQELLKEWEEWASDLMQTHLSYPVLMFYRSQHDGESWLAALTAIMDTCALVQLGFRDNPEWQKSLRWQAQLTFAMARHACVDLSLIIFVEPLHAGPERLTKAQFETLCRRLSEAELELCQDEAAWAELGETRAQYEPYVQAMAERFMLTLPPILRDQDTKDNWQSSAWDQGDHFHGGNESPV